MASKRRTQSSPKAAKKAKIDENQELCAKLAELAEFERSKGVTLTPSCPPVHTTTLQVVHTRVCLCAVCMGVRLHVLGMCHAAA